MKFLIILAVFFAAYVVASESVLYPEAEVGWRFFFYFLRKGFWSMFGEFFLDELDASGDDCTNNATLYNSFETPRCPSNVGKYYGPMLLAVYTIFIQILLFSLLIALFNSTIAETEKRREMIWHDQKFQLTLKYTQSYVPLLPFTFVRPFFNLKTNNPFSEDVDLSSDLKDFERSCAKDLIDNIDNGSIFKELKTARNRDLKEDEDITMSKISRVINHSFDRLRESLASKTDGTAEHEIRVCVEKIQATRAKEKKGKENTTQTTRQSTGPRDEKRNAARLSQTDVRRIAAEVVKMLRHSESAERFSETASIYMPARDFIGHNRGLSSLQTDHLTEEAALVVLKTPGHGPSVMSEGTGKLTISRARTRLFAIRSRNKRGLEWRCVKVRPLADKK